MLVVCGLGGLAALMNMPNLNRYEPSDRAGQLARAADDCAGVLSQTARQP
jgi:hypothetical protein